MISYRKVTIEDKTKLWEFYKKWYKEEYEFRIDPIWTWLYVDNPICKDKNNISIYIAEDQETKKIIGHSAVSYQFFNFGGKEINIAWWFYFIVDENYRGKGIANQLLKFNLSCEKDSIYMAISLAPISRIMLLKQGGVTLPKIFTLSFPLHIEKNLILELLFKKFHSNRFLKPLILINKKDNIITVLLKTIIFKTNCTKIKNQIKKDTFRNHSSIIETEFNNPFFFELRSRFKDYFEVYPNDNRDYIHWKFEYHPVKKFKLFICQMANNEGGYVILRNGIYPENNFGIISEIFATSAECIQKLISFCKSYFVDANCSAIHVIIQKKEYLKIFNKNGFFITNKREPVAVSNEKNIFNHLKDTHSWFFSFESQDLDFFPNKRA